MTKEQYIEGLAKHFSEAKANFLLQIQAMNRANFLKEAEMAWDRAREKYGPECDLHTRNLLQEAHKEAHDGIEYRAAHLMLRRMVS